MSVTAKRQPTLETGQIGALFDAAQAASENAYAKYSNFRVGAALLAASGKIYAGCNVENISYPLGTCAEESAIARARTSEGMGLKAIAIAVYATNHPGHAPCTPCGGCRQRIYELGPDVIVWFYDSELKRQRFLASELLPEAFNF